MRRALPFALLSLAACTQEGRVLGGGSDVFRADALAAGPYHTCAIKSGSLSCWGRDDDHQLGTTDTTNSPTPLVLAGTDWAEVAAGELHTCARRTGGSVWCWGDNESGQAAAGATPIVTTPTFVSTAAPAAQIATTHDFTCSIYLDGTLWCWGANAEGQLAQDDPFPGPGVDSHVPVRVGADCCRSPFLVIPRSLHLG
jgi:alpha-tubulin suppressor-like RCC1 family protein